LRIALLVEANNLAIQHGTFGARHSSGRATFNAGKEFSNATDNIASMR
jgi:hypothetical protein